MLGLGRRGRIRGDSVDDAGRQYVVGAVLVWGGCCLSYYREYGIKVLSAKFVHAGTRIYNDSTADVEMFL